MTELPGDPISDDSNQEILYWSIRGEVACALHVPERGSARWTDERWTTLPPGMNARFGVRYQCQHCRGTAIARRKDDY